MNDFIDKIYATGSTGGSFNAGVPIPGSNTSSYTYDSYVVAIMNWAISIGFALAVLMIIYGGIRYIISRGSQSDVSEAKEIITGAIIGFVTLLLIKFILKTLNLPFS